MERREYFKEQVQRVDTQVLAEFAGRFWSGETPLFESSLENAGEYRKEFAGSDGRVRLILGNGEVKVCVLDSKERGNGYYFHWYPDKSEAKERSDAINTRVDRFNWETFLKTSNKIGYLLDPNVRKGQDFTRMLMFGLGNPGKTGVTMCLEENKLEIILDGEVKYEIRYQKDGV